MTMTPSVKYSIGSVLLYVLIFLAAEVGEHISPGGPSVPGLGMFLMILLLPILCGLLFLVFLIGRVLGHRSCTAPLIVNAIAILVVIAAVAWG